METADEVDCLKLMIVSGNLATQATDPAELRFQRLSRKFPAADDMLCLQGTLNLGMGVVIRGLNFQSCRASASAAFQSLCREVKQSEASHLFTALLPSILLLLQDSTGERGHPDRRAGISSVCHLPAACPFSSSRYQ